MGKDDDISDLDEQWEDDSEDSADSEPVVAKIKPVENKDARRRLDDLLEMNRVKRWIEDDF